jgi:hypothetical protein
MLSCERPSVPLSLLRRKKLAVKMDLCLKRTGGRHFPRGPPRMAKPVRRARVDVAEAGEWASAVRSMQELDAICEPGDLRIPDERSG